MLPSLATIWQYWLYAAFLFRKQDLPVIVLTLVMLFAQPSLSRPEAVWRLPQVGNRLVPASVALVVLLTCWMGHALVLGGYDLSRDEQMATFDAIIFGHQRLFWPIAPEWRPIAAALNQLFILPIGDHEAWVSAYLPVNAAFRALVGLVVDPALTSPLFVAMGVLALWHIAARLWPGDMEARLVTLTLYVGSSQVIVTGMTAYAMSAHLGLNLVWLALYLRGGRIGHGGALGVGWLATGLHQPLFHPVFALPFILILARRQRWQAFWAYMVGYALIGVFWFAWPIWVSSHGTTPAAADDLSGTNYLARLLMVLRRPDASSAWVMSLNLLRFIAWQHLLLLPLVAVGLGATWRGNAVVRALAAGPVLIIVVMFVLLPYQANGWGYRYLHGFIGNLCLLGGFGWRALAAASIRRTFAYGSVFTFFVLLPVHLWMAHAQVAPYAMVDRMIRGSGADVTIIDTKMASFGHDLVINRPDLAWPLRLDAAAMRPDQLGALCAAHSVLFVGADELLPINAYFGQTGSPSADLLPLQQAARAAGCVLVRPR